MKQQVLLIALALSCAYATEVSAGFGFDIGNWIVTLFNRFILQILLSFYSIVGLFAAVFGSPLWFSNMAYTAVKDSFKMPAYDKLGDFNGAAETTTS